MRLKQKQLREFQRLGRKKVVVAKEDESVILSFSGLCLLMISKLLITASSSSSSGHEPLSNLLHTTTVQRLKLRGYVIIFSTAFSVQIVADILVG